MSSVDERIVDLQFNNQQFEQGVATSLGTLDRLKKGLNLEASSKSLNGLKEAGRSFSLANVVENVQTVASRFSALGIVGDQVLRRLTDSAFHLGQKLLTAIPNQIIEGGKRRAQNLEKAKFQLEGLGIAWDQVSDSISEAVQDTAYGLDAAAVVASQYVASGVQLGDEMTRSLRAVSGVAAMTNSSYEDTGRIFTTVAGQGRLMGDQLNQLAARGLNVAAALGKSMNKSEAEIRKMVSKGQIDFKTFALAMDDAFGSHAKEADKTFSGALSNVKASLSRMGAQFATPAYEELRKVLVALIPVLKDIEKYIKPVSAAFTALATSASAATVNFLGQMHDLLSGGLKETAKETTKAAEEISENEQDLQKVAQDVLNGVYGNGEARRKALEEANYSYEEVQSLVNKLINGEEILTEETEKGTKTAEKNAEVNEKLNKSRERQRNKMNEITGLTKDLSDRTARLSNITAGLGAALSIVGQFGSAVYTAIIEPLSSSAMSKAQGLLDSILVPLSDLGLKLVELDKSLKGSNFFNDKITGFLEKFNEIKSSIAGLSGVQKLVSAFDRLRTILGNIASAKMSDFTAWLRSLNANKGDFGNAALQAVLRTVDILSNLLGNAMNVISNVIQRAAAIARIVSSFSSVKRLTADLKALFEVIKGIASDKLSKFTTWLSQLGNESLKLGSGPLRVFFKAIETVANGLADFIEWILAGTPAVDGFFGSIGRVLSGGLTSGITGFFEALKSLTNIDFKPDASKGVLGFIAELGKIPDALGKGAIKTIGTLIKGIGKIFSGTGLKAIASIIKTGLLGKVLLNLNSFINGLKKGTTAIVPFREEITSTLNSIKGALGSFQKEAQTKQLISIATAIAILAGSLVVLASIDPDKMVGGLIAMGLMMAGLVKTLEAINDIDIKDKGLGKVAASMVGIAIAIGLLAGSIAKLSGLSWEELARGLTGVIALMFSLVGVVNLIKSQDKTIMKVAAAMILLGAGVRILAGAVIKLSGISWGELVKGLVGVGALMAGIVGMTRFMGESTNMISVGVGMIAIAAAMQMLVGVLTKLGKMDLDVLKQGFIGLAGSLTILAIALNVMPTDTLAIGAGLVAMAIGLNLVAAAMKTIGSMSGDQLAISLIGMAGAFTILGVAVAGFGMAPTKLAAVAAGLILMTIALNGLAIALKIIGSLSGDQIATALIGMAGAFAILGVAVMALSLIAGPIAIVGGALIAFGAGCAVAGGGLIVFSAGVGALLAVLGTAADSLAGITGAFISGIKEAGGIILESLQTGINDTADWLMNGGTKQIAEAIIKLVGSILKIVASVFFMLPSYLIYYAAEAIDKFLAGIGIDFDKIMDTLKYHLANIWDGIQLWWFKMMANNMADGGILGEILRLMGFDFEGAAKEVEERIKSRKEKAEEASKEYAEGHKEGITEGYAEAEQAANEGRSDYEGAVNTPPQLDSSTGMAGIDAYFNSLYTSTSEGGQKATTEAGTQVSNVEGKLTPLDVDATSGAAGVGAYFINIKNTAETEGSAAQKAVEEQVRQTASKLTELNIDPELGAAGVNTVFSNIIETSNTDGKEAVKAVEETTKEISDAATLDEAASKQKHVDEYWQAVVRDMISKARKEADAGKGEFNKILVSMIDADASSDKIYEYLLEGLGNGATEAGNILAENLSPSNNSALSGIPEEYRGLSEDSVAGLIEGWDTGDFMGLIDELGIEAPEELRNLWQSHSPSQVFMNIGKDADLGLAQGISKNQAPVKTAITVLALASISALNRYHPQFLSSGKTAGGMYALGILSKRSSANSAGSSIASSAKSGATKTNLYSTGQAIGQGLINGIRSKVSAAYSAGKSIGASAGKGAKDGAKVNSPSKITIKVGEGIGEGLVLGMKRVTSGVVSAGSSLGATAAKSLKNPLSVVTDILGADFDVDPTIRPVLDLSDVQNGARSIGGILSGYSVNAGLINASMNGRVNVSNADVVAAIGDLSNKFDNLPTGDSITIGGITYDDGTGIADAVRQLAAAARVQRRA